MTTRPSDRSPEVTVIYDGACGICDALRGAIERRDRAGALRLVPYQTADLDAIAPGLTRNQASRSVILVAPDGTRRQGARAIFETLCRLPGVWRVIGKVGALPPISLAAEPFYRLVARHRARLSRWLGLTACRITFD